MDEFGMLIPVLVACIGLYALYWARKEVVQPEGVAQYLRVDQGGVVAGDEAAATADEATEIEPTAGTEGGAIPLESERAPEAVS